jgi:uncharacterized membrane protein
MQVTKAITVNRPREQVYAFWRELTHLPSFMAHLQSVTVAGDGRSHWVARAPGGDVVEWDAEIVEDRADELITWRSVAGSEITNRGSVRFERAPVGRGTEIHVELEYEAPGGTAGAAVASLLGAEPGQQVRDDLRRLKQLLETGEVVRSDGSLGGAGQGASKQRPAQAPTVEELETRA